MFHLVAETINRLRYKLPTKPRYVQIEVTNRCNLDCHMCPREDLNIELEHMDWDKFTTVVNKLQDHEDITLTGWGEPFLHPKIFDMIAYCNEKRHKVMITSNGLFTHPSFPEKILNSGLDQLTFSIDSIEGHVTEGHTSSKVFENIEAVADGRKNGSPLLRLQATLHAGCEKDLYDVIRFGAKIGFQVVNVGRLDRKYAPELRRPNEEEEARIFAEADRLAHSLGIQLDWLQYAVSSGLTRFVYRLLRRKLHRSGGYCLKTFDSAYVSREGNVTPCCLLPDSKMGNMLHENIDSIWQSKKFNDFRENYRETCGSCDLWTIAQVDKN
ncbi:MAG: radical SAM protein [Nitrospinota bacterium]|nr:radical SAM protein [Nitrospinota bacterium]